MPNGRPACVLELAWGSLQDCYGGSLREYFKQWPTETVANVIFQMWTGLRYLHEHGVLHRDIKPANLLIFKSNAAADNYTKDIVLKIADFGSALVRLPCGARTNYQTCGPCQIDSPARIENGRDQVVDTLPFDEPRTNPITTLWYRAPEVAFGLVKSHGPAMDVWAAGLVTAELISQQGKAVFTGLNTEMQLKGAICAKFGTPTVENNMMPSYFAQYGQDAMPPWLVRYVLCSSSFLCFSFFLILILAACLAFASLPFLFLSFLFSLISFAK